MEAHLDITHSAIKDMLREWQEIGGEALHARGKFHVALSGGGLCEVFYPQLIKTNWPWEATNLFITNELPLPVEDLRTNYQQIFKAFYPKKIRLHRWKTEKLRSEGVAADYEKEISIEIGLPPRFDLIILPIGKHGEVAGLYPNTDALKELQAGVFYNRVSQISAFRYTFTHLLLARAYHIWLVSLSSSTELAMPLEKVWQEMQLTHLPAVKHFDLR
jgi:6-phosphogluconolactonase/glucosamine-6-phosphate isomerase/deaminase